MTVGYKYFAFEGETRVAFTYRGKAGGSMHIYLVERGQILTAESQVLEKAAYRDKIQLGVQETWHETAVKLSANGAYGLYFVYEGESQIDMKNIILQ